jgi:tetratricopeptide (TPR) repeat protein
VAYESIPADDRPDLHRRLAWRLEGDRTIDPAALGHHFRLGGVPERAARHLEEAGREARRLSAFATARDRYSEALDEAGKASWSVGDQTRLRLALEEILEVLADREGQLRLLGELEEPARIDPVVAAEITRRRASLMAAMARFDEAGELAGRALELHTRLGDTTGRAEDLQTLGAIAMWGSHYLRAVDWLEAALDLAPADSLLEANIRQKLCDVLHQVYRFTEAQAHINTAVAIYERHQDQRGLAGALGSQGALYGQMGRASIVEATLLRATSLCEDIGYGYGVAINSLNLGHHLTISGQAARALGPAEHSRSTFRAMDNPRGVAMVTANLASLYHALGNDVIAERLNDEALTIFDSLENHAGAALCHGTQAEIARRRGDHAAAWSALNRGLASATDAGAGNARFQLRRTEAHLRLDAGELEEGLRVAGQAYAECADAGAEWLLPDLAVPLARALLLDGQAERVLEVTANHMGSAQEAAVLYWRMQAHEQIGDHAAAHTALEAAHTAMLRQLEGLSAEDVTTSLTTVPLHRDIDSAWRRHRPQTVTVRLAAASAPTGRAVHPSELIEVEWTIRHPLDDEFTAGPALRAQQLKRLTDEATAAGAAATVVDLATALGVSTATIRRDINNLRRSGQSVSTRGHRG